TVIDGDVACATLHESQAGRLIALKGQDPCALSVSALQRNLFAADFLSHNGSIPSGVRSCHFLSTSDHSGWRRNCAAAKGQRGMIVFPDARASSTARVTRRRPAPCPRN